MKKKLLGNFFSLSVLQGVASMSAMHVDSGGMCLMIVPGKQKLAQAGNEVQQIVSFGAAEGLARALNWSTMALLPLLLRSSEEYGRVGLLVAIEMLAANISLMGMNRAVLRFYAKDESPGTLLRSILTIWAGLAWLPLAGVLLLRFASRETFFGIPLAPHLLLLSFIVAIFNLNLLCVSIGRAQRNLAIFLRFRLCYAGLKFVCVLLMARLLGHSLSYVAGVGVSVLAMLIFIVPFLRGRAGARAGSYSFTVWSCLSRAVPTSGTGLW